MKEPASKRAVAYIDGQNLFNAAKEAFGYPYPNYIRQLTKTTCTQQGWNLITVHFYTGIPDSGIDPNRHHFWVAKLAAMGTRNIHTYSRPLRYSNQLVNASDGSLTTAFVGREKGIDIRLALDVVRSDLGNQYDVAVIFSQDQDVSEVADEIRKIARRDDRWIKVACAFPCSPTSRNCRGLSVSKVFPAGTILIKPWPVKPSLTEQENIAYAIGLVGRKLEIHESKKSALQDLFKTTLNKLMTGEIRVDDLDIDVSEVDYAEQT